MWSLLSSHALTVWMPVCAVHMSVGLSVSALCPFLGQHQSNTRAVEVLNGIFIIIITISL